MRIQQTCRPGTFRVIEGGKNSFSGKRYKNNSISDKAHVSLQYRGVALTTEIARLYALALLRDVPFRDMDDLNSAVWIDGATRFTLHELLTELSALPRPDPHDPAMGSMSVAVSSSLSVQGDPGHRPRHGGDGPWKISDLVGGAPRSEALSVFLGTGILGSLPPSKTAATPRPALRAPMSVWLDWLGHTTGAGLPLPNDACRMAPVRTPRDLMTEIHSRDARQIGLSAALFLLAQGVPLDAGLSNRRNGTGWTAQQLLALMIDAAVQASDAARRHAKDRQRLDRPAVLAARLALMHECPDMCGGPDADKLAQVLRTLTLRTPRLLDWIGRLNAAAGTNGFAVPNRDGSKTEGWSPLRFRQNLMLPRDASAKQVQDGQVATGRSVVAGALVTCIKAVLMCDRPGHSDISTELDKLAENAGLGRCLSGGSYGYENAQELRMGQEIAVRMLCESLEAGGVRARCSFRDFGGRRLRLEARPSSFGQPRLVRYVDDVPQVVERGRTLQQRNRSAIT